MEMDLQSSFLKADSLIYYLQFFLKIFQLDKTFKLVIKIKT